MAGLEIGTFTLAIGLLRGDSGEVQTGLGMLDIEKLGFRTLEIGAISFGVTAVSLAYEFRDTLKAAVRRGVTRIQKIS